MLSRITHLFSETPGVRRIENLERYRLLFEHGQDIVFFARVSDLRIIDANAAAVRAYGYTREELLRMTPADLRAPESRAALPATIDAIRAGQGRFDFVQMRKDGTTFPAENVAEIVTIGGEEIFINVVRDVSERERTRKALAVARDQAMEASRLKSEFVATMSHEIRTPMNGIIGMSDLLIQTQLTDEQREFAMTIRESSYALLTIINDILDFSKIEAGKLQLEVVEFEPVRVIESVADLLATQAHAKRLSLMTYIDPKIPNRLLGDPGRLRQILINLIGNAVKFTEHGSIAVLATLVDTSEEETCIRIEVGDTGIGMSPHVLAKLFQPFTQADGSTTRRFGGTGLGLSIAKRLVEFMNGTISATSKEGLGSTFAFTIWLANAPERAEADIDPGMRLRGLRAMVVDDDATAREILCRQIDSWGLSVEAFESPVAAYAALRSGRKTFDVALIDLQMPRVDGISLARQIRCEPNLANLRLIMISAFDDADARKEALAAGFAATLTKPVRQSQLFDCIASVMELCGDQVTTVTSSGSLNGGRRPGRILVVEDNAVNQRLARRQLEKLCSDEISIVSNGQEAVNAVETEDYALVFMDCQMPVMDGFTASKTIRRAEALTGNHVPIVAMTANALDGDREKCLTAGMDDYIAKPIQLDELRRAIARWLPESVIESAHA